MMIDDENVQDDNKNRYDHINHDVDNDNGFKHDDNDDDNCFEYIDVLNKLKQKQQCSRKLGKFRIKLV